MKTQKLLSLFIILFLFISGCQHKDQEINKPEINKTAPPPSSEEKMMTNMDQLSVNSKQPSGKNTEKTIGNITEQNTSVKDVTNRMIIRTGSMSLEVDKYDETAYKITESIKKFNGYVSNTTSSQNSSGKKQGTLILKVPADKYDALISEVSTLGKVMSQNINASDITEEFIDLEARQKTQKELEQRLLKLLSEKTARLADIVEVEEKLASVRQKIESVDGRMRYLKNQSEMSTLSLSIYEPALLETSSGGGFFYEIGQGIKKGLKGFTEVLSGLIMIVIALLPVFVILYIIYWIIKRIIKKRKERSKV